MAFHSRLLIATTLLGILNGCNARETERARVTLFAAASTTDAVEEIAGLLEQHHGTKVVLNFASSSTLAQQIIQGADAAVFLSANEQWADEMERNDLVAQRCDLLGNRLVIIVAADSPISIETPEDLLGSAIRHVAIADPEGAPAGQYSKESLAKLGLWDRVKPKLAVGRDVREALTYVETSAAEAGIVYATDAAVSDRVRVAVELDEGLTKPIRYAMVLLKVTENESAAKTLFEFLASPEAANVYRRHGFTVVTGE